jgi:ABC-type transport system involved in multi-copper enzyme maturation permease subunit
MASSVAGYRPWHGTLRGAWFAPWPIARVALGMVFRRKLFWVMYALALINFLSFFFGIYLLSQIRDLVFDTPEFKIFFLLSPQKPDALVNLLEKQLSLGGTPQTYRNFIWMQGYIVMTVLALAGALLIGNDYQHGSVGFYLAKPISRWHYLLGKLLAVAVFVNLMTTLPALALFVEFGLLHDWSYFSENMDLFWGILGYGLVLSVPLALLVLTLATWLRRMVPLALVWVGLLFFGRTLSRLLVDVLGLHERWRLIDIWNNLYILGSRCLGVYADLTARRGRPKPLQPDWLEAAAVMILVCVTCLMYLDKRIRAVEIVS